MRPVAYLATLTTVSHDPRHYYQPGRRSPLLLVWRRDGPRDGDVVERVRSVDEGMIAGHWVDFAIWAKCAAVHAVVVIVGDDTKEVGEVEEAIATQRSAMSVKKLAAVKSTKSNGDTTLLKKARIDLNGCLEWLGRWV